MMLAMPAIIWEGQANASLRFNTGPYGNTMASGGRHWRCCCQRRWSPLR